ncbi:MAG: hypothetical protein MUC87_07530 [Bacteroidia bacterium]|jgi:hypothetical protein|nr:hypothetical protein [Bacteroidia bacterium]
MAHKKIGVTGKPDAYFAQLLNRLGSVEYCNDNAPIDAYDWFCCCNPQTTPARISQWITQAAATHQSLGIMNATEAQLRAVAETTGISSLVSSVGAMISGWQVNGQNVYKVVYFRQMPESPLLPANRADALKLLILRNAIQLHHQALDTPAQLIPGINLLSEFAFRAMPVQKRPYTFQLTGAPLLHQLQITHSGSAIIFSDENTHYALCRILLETDAPLFAVKQELIPHHDIVQLTVIKHEQQLQIQAQFHPRVIGNGSVTNTTTITQSHNLPAHWPEALKTSIQQIHQPNEAQQFQHKEYSDFTSATFTSQGTTPQTYCWMAVHELEVSTDFSLCWETEVTVSGTYSQSQQRISPGTNELPLWQNSQVKSRKQLIMSDALACSQEVQMPIYTV